MQQIGGEGGTLASEYFEILDEVSTTGKSFFFFNMTSTNLGGTLNPVCVKKYTAWPKIIFISHWH